MSDRRIKVIITDRENELYTSEYIKQLKYTVLEEEHNKLLEKHYQLIEERDKLIQERQEARVSAQEISKIVIEMMDELNAGKLDEIITASENKINNTIKTNNYKKLQEEIREEHETFWVYMYSNETFINWKMSNQ